MTPDWLLGKMARDIWAVTADDSSEYSGPDVSVAWDQARAAVAAIEKAGYRIASPSDTDRSGE